MADRSVAPSPGFTWRGIRAGIAAAAPLAASAAVYGIIFGALAAQAGLELWVSAAMSAVVFAGGAQVASLQIWASPISLAAVWATTFAVNSRYILLSASLRSWLGGAAAWRTYGMLFTLSDGGWALAIRRWRSEPVDAGFLFGTGAPQYVLWVAGTFAGHLLGNRIGAPEAFGLDFIFPAFFAALAAGMWRKRSDLGPILIGAAGALVASGWLPGHWSVIAGGLAGSIAGIFAHERQP